MSKSAPSLAKFSRPRLFAVQKRERLFTLLDEARAHPLIWISGPPGAGKSTLLASYVEARKLPGIWFQADAGDGEPATFFHYLGAAARELAGSKRNRSAPALPQFGPEYAGDLAHFTRRYLREFFALFPRPAVLVVDNMHEASGDPAWRVAFAEGMRELPEGLNVVFLARTEPSPEMSRFLADQSMVRIGWDALRFTEDEAVAITAASGLDRDVARAIHRMSEGWAAGIVLIREHLARIEKPEEANALVPEGKEAVFSYFTGEIFGRARPENQRLLTLAALLPSITGSEARALGDHPEAERLLDHLYRRHLFIDRRRGATEPVYHFHALFREFLLEEGARRLRPEDRRQAQHRAAELLAARGETEAAATLYRDAGNWDGLARHVLEYAPVLVAQGRTHTLHAWLEWLPEATRAAEPRFAYWLATALIYTDPARAKPLLAAAHAAFERTGHVHGQLLAAAAAVDCHYFEWADFAPLDQWIEVFEKLIDTAPPFKDPQYALRVHSCFLIALLFRRPDHPRLAQAAAAVEAELSDAVPVNQRLHAASILFNYYNWSTKGNTAAQLIAGVTPWLREPQITPLNQVWWRVHLAFNHQISGDHAGAQRIMEEAKAIALEYNLKSVLFEIYHSETTALISARDVAGATAALARLASVLSPSRRMDAAYFHNQQAGVLVLQGRARDGAAAAARAVELARETGLPSMQIPHFLARQAICHLHAEDSRASLECYDAAIAEALGLDRRNFELQREIVRAHFARVDGRTADMLRHLREGLAACRDASYNGFLRYSPQICAPLFAAALAHDIEPGYVRMLIRNRNLAAPSLAASAWPWPLAIRALGAFELVRDGTPVASSGKAQKKPLEMLKALVAYGGRNVDAAMLTGLLWPDAEGDDAKSSFDTNLYRLRKLLAVEGALQLAEGKLSLNPAVAWTDVWGFEAALEADPPDVRTALALYRGHFLGLEATLPWMLPMRDRLQARLQRAVLAGGEALERAGQWSEARALYQRVLELDNLAEAVYRRLMICQRELGDPAGALTTYRRCRELLSIVLGRKPAAETEAIRESLLVS